MDLIEKLTSFRNIVQVIERSEGRYLGPLADVRIDPATSAVTAVSFHERDRDAYIVASDIEVLGDVVLVANRAMARIVTPGVPGHSLRSFTGRPVRTAQGRLGRVADFMFDPREKRIIKILLTGDEVIDVAAKDLGIESEAISLPEAYANRVRPRRPEEVGLLTRSLAGRFLGELAFGVRKALTSAPWRRVRAA